MREHIAVKEAQKLNIPIFAMVDTNCDPDGIDYPIPGNDDAVRSIRLFASRIADLWMEGQDIPIYRDIGVSRVQDLPLKKWDMMGGNATFIQLFGTEGMWGCHVLEVPGAGALKPIKHIYEQQYFVVDGRGSTEVWEEGNEDKVHTFEWQKGSLWSVPLNAMYRVVNASSSPALLLGGNTATLFYQT